MHILKKSIGHIALCLLFGVLTCCGCSGDNRGLDTAPTVDASPATGPTESNGKISHHRPIRVVATYSILGDLVRNIGGEQIDLTVLVGPEGDAHTYEPTPQDSRALANADIVFENGLGFEVWLEPLVQASQSKARRVVVTEFIKPRELVVSNDRTEIDPHVWHLPENAMLMIQSITEAFEQADPDHAQNYKQRTESYLKELKVLNDWIATQTASLPKERRKLVTTHDTFGYFADRYDFEVLSVLGSVSSESSDPSAGQVAEMIQRVRSLGVPAIFAENILNPELTNQIAKEAAVSVVPTLYTDALGLPDSPGKDYLSMMRFNVRTIVEALR